MQAVHGDKITIIGVPGLADADAMTAFVADEGVDGIPHLPDLDGALWARFGVEEQRTYVYVNDDGAVSIGGYGRLAEEVEALIAS
ncbi:MAG: hypothetical protein AAFN30_06515 [Actinomycetota bacterium]